jgi:hypothetical protein
LPPSCSIKPYPLLSLNHFTRPINFIQLLLFPARTADPRPRLSGDVRKESTYGLGITINAKKLSRFI